MPDPTDPSDEPQPLDDAAQAKWDAIKGAVGSAADAVAGGDLNGYEAEMNKVRSIDLDLQQILDALHIPEDGGEYTERLVAMLKRIPPNWGRWIQCKSGWYPLLVRLDEQLQAIDPNYEVHQIKEKYGALRFYAEPTRQLACCEAWEEQHPRPDFDDEEACEVWGELQDEHIGTDEHTAADAKWQRRHDAFHTLTMQAELESMRICEETGGIGRLMVANHWYRTIDPLLAGPKERLADLGDWKYPIQHAGDDPEKLRDVITRILAERDHETALVNHLLEARRGAEEPET